MRPPTFSPAMPIGRQFALGKRPPRRDPRTLRFAKYLRADLPPPPPSVLWQKNVASYPMDGNDAYGDCTIAAAAHLIQTWTSPVPGSYVNPTATAVVADYFALTGGPDSGLALLDVLNAWSNAGLGTGVPSDAADKISAYAQLALGDPTEMQQAIALFGGVYLGVVLPDYILSQPLGQPWDVPSSGPVPPPDPNNGHCVPLVGYDGTFFYCVTWGTVTPVTPAFLAAYMDEGYAILSPDWVGTNPAPNGFDFAQLQADLAQLQNPTPPPSPAPPPAPPVSTCVQLLEQGVTDVEAGHIAAGLQEIGEGVLCVVDTYGLNRHALAMALVDRQADADRARKEKARADLAAAVRMLEESLRNVL